MFLVRVSVFLIAFISVENRIYLYNTNDGIDIEYYDCVLLQSLLYCRRPREPINLTRDDDTLSCEQNDGQLHRFSELRSNNTNVSMVLHQWRSTLERVERYSRYLTDTEEPDGFICQCLHPRSFGKNCEYQLPVGETFEETLQWHLITRKNNPEEVKMYGDVVCYETLQCDSGVLCLDWREICDGIQNCLEGKDEENCDLLEMNRCDPEEEYRCMNGMCIPEEFFLDGELDCLDWSDEIPIKRSQECPLEGVSSQCDDHLCPPNTWSCGDGECIPDRLAFQKVTLDPSCQNGHDQHFICETHESEELLTNPNGTCYVSSSCRASLVANTSEEEQCEYLLKCVLTCHTTRQCRCYSDSTFDHELAQVCLTSLIQHPQRAMITPYTFLFFNCPMCPLGEIPVTVLINGTVRCRDALINVTKFIPFEMNLDVRQLIEEHFCQPYLSSISSSEKLRIRSACHHHHSDESSDQCGEWNPCLSVTRLNDGWNNCLNGRDEEKQAEIPIEKSCALVRHHRLCCSQDQSTCLSVMKVGDGYADCENRVDEFWFGTGRRLSEAYCNDRRKDECSLLRQYIHQSWTTISLSKSEVISEAGIPFRSYCDTFWNLESKDDENLSECRQSWVCSEDQWRCNTGQCIQIEWVDDREWDCTDASDEHDRLTRMTKSALQGASRHNFTNRSYFVPSTCPQSNAFLCLSANATQQGFSCFNLSQIGDGHIDCAGAYDERTTLEQCSHQSSMLGYHFRCPSTNTCIPYYYHCFNNTRCPNRSDDEHWCFRQYPSSECFTIDDFTCFNGECLKCYQCSRISGCQFVEALYMYDSRSHDYKSVSPYRADKEFSHEATISTFHMSPYPIHANITQFDSYLSSASSWAPLKTSTWTVLSPLSSLSPYWCNRGLGILLKNLSIVCFCPPQYYGEKCEFHADRLSVLLHLDLSQSRSSSSSETDRAVTLQLLVFSLLNDEVLMFDQFHLRPSSFEPITMNKLIMYFPHRHSSSFRQQRHKRYFNRSSLLTLHPYSIRIELYRTRINEQPTLSGVWKYPLSFAHLPVFRFVKVLRYSESVHHFNPCSRNPCPFNSRCHQLMNNKSEYICLCRENFSGENCSEEDPRCRQGYCGSRGSLCQPNSRLPRRGKTSPFCLCPLNRYGDRCSIELDVCLSNPCLNNGWCIPDTQPDQFICICSKEYTGLQCQWPKPSIHLFLSTDVSHRGAVIQFLQIDLVSLHLILLDQQVFQSVPPFVEYYHDEQTNLSALVLLKRYSSYEDLSPQLHVLSLYLNAISIRGRTQISPLNRCEHRRTFSNGHFQPFSILSLKLFDTFFNLESSPIQYHQICIRSHTRLCFRDDQYLCICAENHTRVECFLLDDQLDRCEHCLSDGRCLKGNPRRSTDFLCLCPECHSGRQCQFNTKSFSFTLDQLFSPDLLSHHRRRTISLLIFFSLLGFFLALPNNLFSFFTLRHPSCLRHGSGHYLLWMSFINQLTLALLTARLIHLAIITTMFRSSSLVDNLLCKLLNYLLISFTRLSSWLSALVALERVYTTVYLNKQWFKKPRVARSLILFTLLVILLSASYELVFVKSFTTIEDETSAMCVIEYPSIHQLTWVAVHQFICISHFLFPLLINLCSTLTIMSIVIKNKMKIRGGNKSTNSEARRTVFRSVLNENREMITRPAITLVPSIFSLFSLPLFIISFSLRCQNLDDNPLRYVLIVFYFLTFIPQILMFYLYVYPSSFYWKQWQSTTICQRIAALRQHLSPTNVFSLSKTNEEKTQDFSSIPTKG